MLDKWPTAWAGRLGMRNGKGFVGLITNRDDLIGKHVVYLPGSLQAIGQVPHKTLHAVL